MILRRYTIFRHLWRESLGVCLMSLLVLLAVTLALFLAELLGDVAEGAVVGSTVFQLLLLRLPEAILLVAPLALLIGLMMSFGEFAQSRQFTVMRASGVGPGMIMRLVVMLAVVWASGLLLVGGWVAPWASRQSDAIAERIADDLVLAGLRPGQFQPLHSTGLTIYVERIDSDTMGMQGVFLHYRGAQGVEVITARRAVLGLHPESGDRLLRLYEGTHLGHADNRSGLPLRRVEFARNDIALPRRSGRENGDGLDQVPLPGLLAGDDPGSTIALNRRLAPVIVSMVLALLALPATLADARASRFGIVLVAVVVYLVYGNTVNFLLIRAGRAGTDVVAAVGAAHLLALGVAVAALLTWWRRW